jgi:hypothetical protein
MRNTVYISIVAGCLIVLSALAVLFLLSECGSHPTMEKLPDVQADASDPSLEQPTGQRASPKGAPSAAAAQGNPKVVGTQAAANSGGGTNGGDAGNTSASGGGAAGSTAGGSRGAQGGKGGGPFHGTPTASRELPVEDGATGSILYEGRWIEGAITQRQHVLLTRRAYAEAVEHARNNHGPSISLAPFDDRRTAVVQLEDSNSYLVSSSLLKEDARAETPIAWEVIRDKTGKWRVHSSK